jgi:hypothetical protein
MRPAWQLDAEAIEALSGLATPARPELSTEHRQNNFAARPATGQRVTLPWDFRTTFPMPLESAIENRRLDESDLDPQNLASLHDEHARHALAILSDLDAVDTASRADVDPVTGKPPRTQKQRETLAKLYAEKPGVLIHAFEVLIDVYAEAFGDDAALAFKQAITSWHAGVEVVGEENPDHRLTITLAPLGEGPDGLPMARPLRHAVAAGAFGYEGDPVHPADPCDEEIFEVTARLAFDLRECVLTRVNGKPLLEQNTVDQAAQQDAGYQASLERYRQDFGDEAATALDEHVRQGVTKDLIEAVGYVPGHPWHYLGKGDGAEPVGVEQIPACERPFTPDVKLPKNLAKKLALLAKMLDDAKQQLARDKERYAEVVGKGVAALSEYDRTIAYGGDDALAWASAVALKYNHVSNGLARVRGLAELLRR